MKIIQHSGKFCTTDKKEAQEKNKIYLDQDFYRYFGYGKLKVVRCKYCGNVLSIGNKKKGENNINNYCNKWCQEQNKELRRIEIAPTCKYCNNKTTPILYKKKFKNSNRVGNIAAWRKICDTCSTPEAKKLRNKIRAKKYREAKKKKQNKS